MPVRATLRRITPLALRSKTILSLTFDDGTSDHLHAARLLAERGLRATFYVNGGRVGADPSCLDWLQLDEMAAAGHEIGAHTANHIDLSQVSGEEAAEQIVEELRALREHGHDPHSFAYPYGARSEEARALVVDAGYSSARRAWGLAADGDGSRAPSESVPPHDRYSIRTVPSFERATTLEQLQRVVLRGERHGGWVPLVFHGVSGGPGEYDLDEGTFREFVDWLGGRSRRVAVRAVGDVVDGL